MSRSTDFSYKQTAVYSAHHVIFCLKPFCVICEPRFEDSYSAMYPSAPRFCMLEGSVNAQWKIFVLQNI